MITCSNWCGSALTPRLRRPARCEFHVFADQAPQHRLHVADHAVEIEHPRLQHLFAAEGQQLPGQIRRPLARLVDLVQLRMQRVVRASAASTSSL